MAATVAYVMKHWADLVAEVEGVKVLYAPDLSLPDPIKSVRRLQVKTIAGVPMLSGGEPFIVFSRRPLTTSDTAQPRIFKVSGPVDTTGSVAIYKAKMASCDFQCLYLSKDIRKVEEFELKYITQSGITEKMTMEVDYGDPIGIINYSLQWKEIDDLQITGDGLDVKALSFTCTVSGWFVSAPVDTGKIITEIDIFYKDYVTEIDIDYDIVT